MGDVREIKTVLLDLDDCLYMIETVPHLMLQRIQGGPALCSDRRCMHKRHSSLADYMKTKLGIPPDNIDSLSSHYYMNFGTTLAGLVVRVRHSDINTTFLCAGQRLHHRLR